MNITVNNALIAEFLKARYFGATSEFDLYGVVDTIEDGENEKHFYTPLQMKFHKDWNWLISVVEKIESLEFIDREGRFNISSVCFDENYTTFIIDGTKGIIQVEGETKIEAVYNAVVEFIKWYNQNK